MFHLSLVKTTGKWNFVSCFQQNCLHNIKFKILHNKNVPNFKTSTENTLQKNPKNHWNHLIKNRIDVISIFFSIFNFCSTYKLSPVRLDSVPYFSVCSFQEQCCHQFPAWSKHNLLTWLLPDPKLWQTCFLPFRFYSCILFVVYSCYHKGSTHCSSRKTVYTTDFYKYQQYHITKYQQLLL